MSIVQDDEPQRHTGYLIRRAQQLHVALWTRHVSDSVSSVQYSILVVLDRVGEASQRELCAEVDLDRSTVADLVARMERRGLISRRRSTVDARTNVVTLTASGLTERRRLGPLVDGLEAKLTGALSSAEREQLRHGLRRMLDDTAPDRVL